MNEKSTKIWRAVLVRRRRGMTLIEIVVAMGLISLLTLGLAQVLTRGMAAYRAGQQTISSQERAARVMREFEFAARAATEVETAHADEFSFYRFYSEDDAYPTKVRYFVEGNQFKVGKTLPQGTPPNITYPAGSETIDFLINDVTNPESLFLYYNGMGEELNTPVTVSDVVMAELSISVDANGDKPPASITERTKVNLRNKKTNL